MDFRAQAHRLLDGSQVFHQEYSLVRSLLEGHGVLQDLRIYFVGFVRTIT